MFLDARVTKLWPFGLVCLVACSFFTAAEEPAIQVDWSDEIASLEALGYVDRGAPASEEVGVTVNDTARAHHGTNLLVSAHGFEISLVDMAGKSLHKWTLSPEEHTDPPDREWFRRAWLLDDGSILAIIEYHSLWRIAADGKVLWFVRDNNHHHLNLTEDGTFFSLTSRTSTHDWWVPGKPFAEEFVTRYDLAGVKLDEISIHRALAHSNYPALLMAAKAVKGKNGMVQDPLHTNSVQVLGEGMPKGHRVFREGNILLSSRRQSHLLILDPETKTIVWAWKGGIRRQHEAQILPSGELMLFNNGRAATGSSVDVFQIPGMRRIWRYKGGEEGRFHSPCCGTASRLPNGNTMVVVTAEGMAREVTPTGETVWGYRTPHRAAEDEESVAKLFDVVRYPQASELSWLRPRSP